MNKEFGLLKNYGIVKSPKSKYGKLVQIVNGKQVILKENIPFPLLVTIKKEYEFKGFKNLKITY